MRKERGFTAEETEAFEMIELASDDLNTLTKAFDLIARVCSEHNASLSDFDVKLPEALIN